jgi:2-C-methyl-D-erythritol 2,4-cyclodiphosphate synthase
MTCKIGIGYDIHKFQVKRKLVLGGVEIASRKGLLGHSDADVLIHAICDALLGALGEGDIGQYFPDTDARYKDVSSVKLLEEIKMMLKRRGFHVVNIDTIVMMETPRLGPLKDEMSAKIAAVLEIDRGSVSVKATTHEGTGDIGRGRAAAAQAVALIQKDEG